MAVYMEKNEFQKSRAFSPAVTTQGGRIVWLAGQTGGRDDQGKGGSSPIETCGAAKQILCDSKHKGDGFARAGMRRNQKVAADRRLRKNGGLDSGRLIVAAFRQGSGERRTCGQECHEMADLGWRLQREH